MSPKIRGAVEKLNMPHAKCVQELLHDGAVVTPRRTTTPLDTISGDFTFGSFGKDISIVREARVGTQVID